MLVCPSRHSLNPSPQPLASGGLFVLCGIKLCVQNYTNLVDMIICLNNYMAQSWMSATIPTFAVFPLTKLVP